MRVGDDEFVIVLRDVSAGDARIVFERVRQLIAARSWSALPADAHLTASVGVTVGSGAINSTTLLASANEALRRAKAAGGDRISFR
jgi:diguanylate cyclase (GGDEF)-like protein